MDKLLVIFALAVVLGPLIVPLGKAILMFMGLIAILILYAHFKPSENDKDDFNL